MNYFDSFLTVGSIAAAVCVATGTADYIVTRHQRQAVKGTDRANAATDKREGETTKRRVLRQEAAPHDIEITTDVNLFWKSALLSGVVSVALGVVVLAWPGISILAASVLFGAYLLASGLAQVIFASGHHVSAGGRVVLFISGAASLILAVLAFRHFGQGYAVLLLAIWIGIGFIFRGVATTISAISDPTQPGRAWSIFLGVISLLAGVTVIAWPFESIVTLAFVAGVWFIVIGVMEIVAAFGMRTTAIKVPSSPFHR